MANAPSDKPVTAYPWKGLTPQDQTGGPGLDTKLTPTANFSQLEFWDEKGNPSLQEYEGRGLLKNKTALITGGDSGIGRAVAICFAREGADVSICYLPEEEEDAQVTKKEIEKAGRRCELNQGNIREESFCKNAVETHVKKFGKLNVLVSNAAMQEICNDLKDINLESVEKTFRTNILGMFCMTKYALQHMKRGDSIVNSTSVASYMGNPQLVDYASTKGAITQFTKSLAQQQASKGIRINGVAPGIIWTPLQPATKGNPPEVMETIGVNMEPLQRPGMPVECAMAYVFLASPMGSYTTGEVIHVNGGLEVQG
ncbi:NAD(P)-binding protein [Hortaea werneckii]|nr:NAD(P)-binding protein [Hortaea werneckii]